MSSGDTNWRYGSGASWNQQRSPYESRGERNGRRGYNNGLSPNGRPSGGPAGGKPQNRSRADGQRGAGYAQAPNARPRNGAAAQPDARAARPRPERPRFDITCAECGIEAQVPFRPLEGRDVFCQPCYRARKGLPREEGERVELKSDIPDSDHGMGETD